MKCTICNSEFEKHVHNQTMCSWPCVRKYRTEKQKEFYHKTKPVNSERKSLCTICKNEFVLIAKSNAKTCSDDCSALLRAEYIKNYRQTDKYRNSLPEQSKRARSKESRIIYMKEYKKKNKQKLNSYSSNRSKTDIPFKLNIILRAAIGRMMKKSRKTVTLKNYVSYTPQELRQHIESKFTHDMGWHNHGRTGWHIDHIKPLSAFKFFDENGNIDEEQIKECMSLENLQPLWYYDNIKKGGIRAVSKGN